MNDLVTKFGLLVFYMGILYYLARYGSTFDKLFQTGTTGTEGLISTLYGNPPFNTYGAHAAPVSTVSYNGIQYASY